MIKDYLKYKQAKKRVAALMKLNSSEVTRDFVLDSRLLEAQQLSALLGLPEITEEDVAASNERARRVSHLVPLVAFFASALSTGVMEYYDTVSPWKNDLTEEERVAMEAWVAKVGLSCTIGVLSQFESLELIKVIK